MKHNKRFRYLRLLLLLCIPLLWLSTAQAAFTSDPIKTIGHGSFMGASGKTIKPDLTFIADTQNYYISTLLTQSRDLRSAKKIRALIAGQVSDSILANALFIDWLVDKQNPANTAHLVSVNGALRWRYILELQTDTRLREWLDSKGINPEIARKLEDNGIIVFAKTSKGGADYIKECAAAGVPIPPPMWSSGWAFQGVIDNEFISTSSQAELMLHTSTTPAGVCLALPRFPPSGSGFSNQANLLGVICLGTQTSKACFWDNPRGKSFTRGVEVDISEFVGGVDLVANAQGTCSDCHAGENPFVVHPEKPPFASLPSLQPLAWYDPLVSATWPQNPGPTNLLDAVASTGKCDSCHSVGSAGRFPDVSTQLPGYCGTVLAIAKGTSSKATMPPFGMDRNQFLAHITALENACGAPPTGGGVVVDVDYPDDKSVISPPIVIDPLYACATQVAVRGGILDAKLSLFINGTLIDSVNVRNPDNETFNVPDLKVGDVVTAMQEFNGTLSNSSPAITVRDHQVDFPSGLPAPVIDPKLIYECAETIAVRHVPGAKLTVYSNGIDPRAGYTSTGWTAMWPAKRPFTVGDEFTAEINLCKDISPLSAPEKAVAAPATVPAPGFNPASIYTGQQLVTVEGLLNGAFTHVDEVGTGTLGNFTTPVSWFPNFDVATPLGRPLASGDQLAAQQILCDKGPETETPPVLECKELPAPRIRHPLAGDTYVVVTQSVPGARIRVYDGGGIEIGDGSGSVIMLTRALTGADTITVVQQLGDCTSSTGYRVSARNGETKG